MKKTIKGITYDTDKANGITFSNLADTVEYDLCPFPDGCVLVKEHHHTPSDPTTYKSKHLRTVLRQLTRRQAVELIVENLIPELLQPDFQRFLSQADKPVRRRQTRMP